MRMEFISMDQLEETGTLVYSATHGRAARLKLGGETESDKDRDKERHRVSCGLSLHAGRPWLLAVQWGVAIEIKRAIKTSARFCCEKSRSVVCAPRAAPLLPR